MMAHEEAEMVQADGSFPISFPLGTTKAAVSVYEIRIPWDDYESLSMTDCFDSADAHDETWVNVAIRPGEEFLWAELCHEESWPSIVTSRRLCREAGHVTGGGFSINQIVCDYMNPESPALDFVTPKTQGLFVSQGFRTRLEQSGLTGFDFHLLQVVENPLARSPLPVTPFMEVTGQIVEAPYRVIGVPNACPNCGYGPIVCSGCSHIDEICPKCEKQAVRPPGRDLFPESRPLLRAPVPQAGRPLLGRTWNGEDFIRTITAVYEFGFTERYYLTRRALDWLQRVHARPYYARPAQVILDGMNDEQLGWLERAQGSAPGVKQ